jgi:hypothetical protein
MKSLLIAGICVLVCSTVSAVAEPSTPTVYGWPVYTAPSEQVMMSSPVHQNRTVTVRRHKQRPVETAKLPTAARRTIGYPYSYQVLPPGYAYDAQANPNYGFGPIGRIQ